MVASSLIGGPLEDRASSRDSSLRSPRGLGVVFPQWFRGPVCHVLLAILADSCKYASYSSQKQLLKDRELFSDCYPSAHLQF